MKFLPTTEADDARANVYYHLTSPRNTPRYEFDYGTDYYGPGALGNRVRFAQYDSSIIPEVGDIIHGDYGYLSRTGRVTDVIQFGTGLSFEVLLEEVI